MPEIIADGETGWLVPDGVVDALALALLEALRNPARSKAMGARGRDRVLAHFTWAHVAKRLIDDLESVRAEPARAPAPRMAR